MKIALVSHEYPPFQGGGIGTYATLMARLFAERGHEVHVITNLYPSATDSEYAKEYSKCGTLHVHRVHGITPGWHPSPKAHANEIRLHREWSPYLAYAERVAECLESVHKEFGLDIAEFPECAAEGYSVIHRRRLGLGFTDLPTTVTLHSPIEDIYRFNYYARQNPGFQRRKALEEATIREADGVNAPSERIMRMVKDRISSDHEDTRPWDVVRLPYELDQNRVAVDQPRKKRSILVVGRVEPRKGVIDLVDAAAPLLVKYPDLTIDLVGRECDAGVVAGTMGDFLRSRLPQSVRNRLVLHGQVPQEHIAEHLDSALACVFASRWDNYPVSCLEAMGAGACCIVSDGVGTAEVLTGRQNALVFSAGNIAALREQLEWVLNNVDLAQNIGAQARSSVVAIADPDAAVQSRLAHYERVIDKAHAPKSSPTVGATISWTPSGDTLCDASVRASAEFAGAHLVDPADKKSDWTLHVPPGDRLVCEAIETLLGVMNARPDAAWVAPWTRPQSVHAPMYAGLDFELPLDLLASSSPRTVLARTSVQVEANPCEIPFPEPWNTLDRRLALEEAGYSGLVVPLWLCDAEQSTQSESGLHLDHDQTALILEQLVDRHQKLFACHGADLWVYAAANSGQQSGPFAPEPRFRELIVGALKNTIKKRFPRLTARARRIINRSE